jgi:toluene monooxygenase system protein E
MPHSSLIEQRCAIPSSDRAPRCHHNTTRSWRPSSPILPDLTFSIPDEVLDTPTKIPRDKEIFVDGILEEIEMTGYDGQLSPSWLHVLSRRYPGHGLQMLASYIGQMAPSGRTVITAALQAADEMRRVQRLSYRPRQLQHLYPDFATDSKERWQTDPLWQPLRMAIGKLLTSYDWAESFVGLNLVLKPLVDELFMTHFSDLACVRVTICSI